MLAFIGFSLSALLALVGLLALADRAPHPYVLPAVRTIAVLAVTAVYITTIWSWS